MIRVSKNLNNIPLSLDDRKTETRRNTCIRDNKYHQKKEFHQRFKQQDIKDALERVYHGKCAFCEQDVILCTDNNLEDCSSTIEHYRPKSQYYWLAYSWDNLLWCCHRCNQNKDNKFEIMNISVEYEENFKNNIHSSFHIYQGIENPKMIHPEFESVIGKISFFNGKIDSDDVRVKYTIDTCKLDRDDLNEKRETIIDDFIESVIDKKLKGISIEDVLKDIMNEIKAKQGEFIALKYWILKNHKSLIEEV